MITSTFLKSNINNFVSTSFPPNRRFKGLVSRDRKYAIYLESDDDGKSWLVRYEENHIELDRVRFKSLAEFSEKMPKLLDVFTKCYGIKVSE